MPEIIQRFISLILIVVLSPLLIACAIVIKITSKGPVLYKQPRHGLNGVRFDIYKFRSMYLGSDQKSQAKKIDSRITLIGKLLRRLSIDELPQLFNVLKGDMVLVGPRPHPIWFDEVYSPELNNYMMRHCVKPGITGLAQVSGARGETQTIQKMKRRVSYDLFYAKNKSSCFDIIILIKTFLVVFKSDAY